MQQPADRCLSEASNGEPKPALPPGETQPESTAENRDREDRLHKVLNGSGFPFQIGARCEIERTNPNQHWQVIAEEHFWTHPKTHQIAFVDLILQQLPFQRERNADAANYRQSGHPFVRPDGQIEQEPHAWAAGSA
jgi:hypothetical protein